METSAIQAQWDQSKAIRMASNAAIDTGNDPGWPWHLAVRHSETGSRCQQFSARCNLLPPYVGSFVMSLITDSEQTGGMRNPIGLQHLASLGGDFRSQA